MSEVTPLDVRNEMFTGFDTFWADRTQIAAPNVPFDPDDVTADAWVRLFILGTTEGERRYSHSVDRNHFSRVGQFTVEVYAREGTDLDVAYTHVESAISWLQTPALDTITFLNISTPLELGPDGIWFQVSVTADWLYFTDRAA